MLGGQFLWKSRETALLPAVPPAVVFFPALFPALSPALLGIWAFFSPVCSRWPSLNQISKEILYLQWKISADIPTDLSL